jgi:uncharacterized membrane protein YeiB
VTGAWEVRKLKDEIELEEEKEELGLKKRVLWFFCFTIIGLAVVGALTLSLINIEKPNENFATMANATMANATMATYENVTIEYFKTCENIQIAKMGIFMILLLTLGILGFVGSMYLAHSTKWSTEMIKKGRTLEYISVILIIGVVLTLALLHIIGKETIGTILGAIAGYVLGKSVAPSGESKE